jgi:hypothetical protein
MSSSLAVLSEHTVGDVTARYVTNEKGHVGLWLYPTSTASELAHRRTTVANESWVRDKTNAKPAIVVESLAHIKSWATISPVSLSLVELHCGRHRMTASLWPGNVARATPSSRF